MPRSGATPMKMDDSPLQREGVKKLGGRASWRAVAPTSPCPIEARREPRPPDLGRSLILSPLPGGTGMSCDEHGTGKPEGRPP